MFKTSEDGKQNQKSVTALKRNILSERIRKKQVTQRNLKKQSGQGDRGHSSRGDISHCITCG